MVTHESTYSPETVYSCTFYQLLTMNIVLGSNLVLSLSEHGAGATTVTVVAGTYTPTTFLTALLAALNTASSHSYTYTSIASNPLAQISGITGYCQDWSLVNSANYPNNDFTLV